jgi:hypothetical protein
VITQVGSSIYHTTMTIEQVEAVEEVFATLLPDFSWDIPEWVVYLRQIVENREESIK